MSERFDRWCMVMGGQVQGAYADRKQAEERAKIIGADVVRLVELRDGESIRSKDEPARAFKVGEMLRVKGTDYVGECVTTTPVWTEVRDAKGGWSANTSSFERVTPANPLMAPWSLVDDARKERDTAIERAEASSKHAAEAWREHNAMKERAEKAEAEVKQLCRDFYAKRMDERAKFERECGMRFRVAGIDQWGDEARWMAAFYFGAKEAKGDE